MKHDYIDWIIMTGGRSWGQATVAELSISGIDTSENLGKRRPEKRNHLAIILNASQIAVELLNTHIQSNSFSPWWHLPRLKISYTPENSHGAWIIPHFFSTEKPGRFRHLDKNHPTFSASTGPFTTPTIPDLRNLRLLWGYQWLWHRHFGRIQWLGDAFLTAWPLEGYECWENFTYWKCDRKNIWTKASWIWFEKKHVIFQGMYSPKRRSLNQMGRFQWVFLVNFLLNH